MALGQGPAIAMNIPSYFLVPGTVILPMLNAYGLWVWQGNNNIGY